MPSPLKVAAAQPACAPNDLRANALAHAGAIRSARARIVVFPELSLTGYDLAAEAVPLDDDAFRPIAAACAEFGTIALVGAPVAGDDGIVHIAMVGVTGGGVEVVYRKGHLGGDEGEHFAAGNGPTVIDVDGRRVGVGICKDTGVAQHVAEVAALGVDLYVAGLVHRPDELAEQDDRAVRIARACDAYVAFASFAGPTGGGYERTAGCSSIWAPDGRPLDRAGPEPGGIATAVVP
jgi:predicted amidohydrolase